MITAGIDMGSKTIKVVILRDAEVVGKSIALAGFENREAAETAFAAALDDAGISMDDVEHIVATGAGHSNAPYAERDISEVRSSSTRLREP
jgi:benzoyl-CoA reductase subunit D